MARAVAFVLPSFAGGGAERVLLNLMAALDRDRFAPAMVVLDGAGPLAPLVPADLVTHDLARPRLRTAVAPLVRCLRRLRPAVVVSTFGHVNLIAGVHFLTAMIGLFAIPQLVSNLVDGTGTATRVQTRLTSVLPKRSDLKKIRLPVTIGSLTGAFLGILPGAGGPIAAFISYDYTRKASKQPEQFGKGAVEGVAAPESANNAVTGGALIPMMTLGIPGDPVTAILIGALIIHGLAPGPLMFLERADFAYGVIFSFFWANIFNFIIAMAALRLLVKLLATPRALLMPTVAVLCVIGSFTLRNNFFDVYVMLFFGLMGLAMRWLDMPVVPLLLALVLGGQLEENLRVALVSSKGDFSIFFTSPISLTFLILSLLSIVWSLRSARRAKRATPTPSTETPP